MPNTPYPAPAEPGEARAELTAFTPVPRQRNRHDGWSPEVQRAFIAALADYGSVRDAARKVGRAPEGAYLLRRHPQGAEFAAAWEAALAHGMRRLEDALMERALNGVEVPVYSYGKLVGARVTYNDRLGMFMLRNRLPDRFAAGGGARALNAVGKMELERQKAQWREEWQAERDREEAEGQAWAGDFVDQIQGMHVKWWGMLGPRARAAYIHFRRLERLEGRAWMDGEEPDETALAAAEAEYREVFADDGRSRARLLGEVCGLGDKETCPEVDEDGEQENRDQVEAYATPPKALPPPAEDE